MMKYALVALVSAVAATEGYPENLHEMFPNKESLYGNNWDTPKPQNPINFTFYNYLLINLKCLP